MYNCTVLKCANSCWKCAVHVVYNYTVHNMDWWW